MRQFTLFLLVGVLVLLNSGLCFGEQEPLSLYKLSKSEYQELSKTPEMKGCPVFDSMFNSYQDHGWNVVILFKLKNNTEKTIKGYLIIVAGSHDPRNALVWPLFAIYKPTHTLISVPSSVDRWYQRGWEIEIAPEKSYTVDAWISWPDAQGNCDALHIHLYNEKGKELLEKEYR